MVSTLIELLRARAGERGEVAAYTFLADGERESERLTRSGLDARARALGASLQRLGAEGERALLLYPPGLDFVAAFFGCLYGGVTAVPAYPPRSSRLLPRLRAIAGDARPKVVLTTRALLAGAEAMAGRLPELAGARWVATDDLDPALAEEWREPAVDGGTLAFLQYTSGSTSLPKGVMVTHGNLLHNQEMIRQAFGQSERSVIVGWLPLYHDMGLIGNVLQPLYVGAPCVLMSPVAFLQRPLRWLEAVSRYRGTTSGGPNFAYDLCARRIAPAEREALDLSSWEVAFNGAEPVRAETLDRFAAAFAASGFRRTAFYPCYGLAEATLFVAGGAAGREPAVEPFATAALERGAAERAVDGDPVRRLVGCGAAWLDQEIAVADPETGRPCPPGRVGEIWVAGSSVAQGYWNRPEATARDFGARLAGEPAGRFLRTGDLGFLAGGELFVTGRVKDLIILRGRNHYPQDLEATAEESHPALRPGCGAAFAVDDGGEERLVIVQEIDRRREGEAAAAAEAVRRAVAEAHEVRVHEVALVRAGAVPKTSSGKIRRAACRAAWRAGELAVVDRSTVAGREGEAGEAPPSGLDRAALLAAAPEAREGLLAPWLRAEAARALGVSAAQIDPAGALTALGLDSLGAAELKARMEEALEVHVSLAALLEGASLEAVTANALAGLTAAHQAEELPAAEGPETGDFPLSAGQRALWFIHRLAPDSLAYVLAGAARVRGALDSEAFAGAVAALVRRHPALRTTFGEGPDGPFQRIHERLAPEIRFEDLAAWSPGEVARRVRELAWRPFDLERGPLFRVAFLRAGPGEDVIVFAVHHIVCDFWSAEVMARDLGALYGRGEELPPLPLRYTDCARWWEARLAGPAGERLWRYWRERLAGSLPPLELPTDRPRPPRQTWAGGSRNSRLGAPELDALRSLGRERGATLYAILLAGFQALLGRYTRQEDLLVGSPTTGRAAEAMAGLVGYFVNPVALRADLSGDPGFGDFVERTRAAALGALDHQDLPLPLLAERLLPERDPSRSPLFDVAFAFERERAAGSSGLAGFALGEGGVRLALGGLELESLALATPGAAFDLTLTAAELGAGLGAGLGLSLRYNAALFDPATAERLLGHLRVLLAGATEAPERRLSELPLLDTAERDQLLNEWSGTAVDHPRDPLLHELFLAQVERTPDAVALIHGHERLTYRQLAARSVRVASRLRAAGVGPEVRVGIFLRRTPELIATLIGVQRAGGAYVPLDPAYPRERLAAILEDAGAPVLVTEESLRELLPATGARILLGDEDPSEELPAALPELPAGVRASLLAYLIYTSGSTGRPKGVAIEHRSAVALIYWLREVFPPADMARVLASTSICFDMSIFEIFATLAMGGAMVLAENALELPELPAASEVTLINTVPSAMAELLRLGAVPRSVRTVNLGGEPLRGALTRRIYELGTVERVFNLYGPSEDTTFSTFELVPRQGEPTIGRPVTNTWAYIVDAGLRLVPTGVPGELFLGGEGISRGYLGRPDLTAERYLPNPFGSAGERMYRTGDLTRWLADGRLEYLGRIDHQVKVRGFRVEPGEIEAALLAHPEVAEAAVIARELAPGDLRLVAFVAPAQASPAALRSFLARRLPEYMVPSSVAALPALPLTPNGKIDRRALSRMSVAPAGRADAAAAAPRTPAERFLAGLWSELLGVERVGVHDSFFSLGGHSLLATQLVSRVREAFAIEIPLGQIFETPTVAALAACLPALAGVPAAAIRPASRAGDPPLSFAQERLWFLDRLEPGSALYNMPAAARLRGPLDPAALAAAFGEVARRHEVLRTGFVEAGRRPAQRIAPWRPWELPVTDLAALPAGARGTEAMRLAEAEAARPFDLARPPLLRTTLLRLGEAEHVLLLTLHHIAADGWSIGLLLRELAALYAAARDRTPSPLPEPALQYADFAVWQREWLRGEALEAQLSYWRRALAGAPEPLDLPADRPRPTVPGHRGAHHPFAVSADLAAELRAYARRQGQTPFMLLLAVFQALLSRLSREEDVVVGSPIANRNRLETEPLIGFFVNTLALRTDLAGNPSFAELARRVRAATLGGYAHQDLPFEKLVAELAPGRDTSRPPLFQVLFALQNAPAGAPALPGLELELLPVETGLSKFDLSLSLDERGEALAGTFEYSAELFDAVTVERWGEYLLRLLEGALADSGCGVAELPLLSAAESGQLLAFEGGDAEPVTAGELVPARLAARAAAAPDAVALEIGEERLSYGELNRRANRLAGRLRELGVGPEAVVGICLERSAELVVAMLAVWKAGGAWVPLDPSYPTERLAYLLADSGARLLVSETGLAERLGEGRELLLLDRDPLAGSEEEPRGIASPGDLAYLIYTSGSTGHPKGVRVEHGSLAAFLRASGRRFGFAADDRMPALAPFSFDIFQFELWSPLIAGGTCALVPLVPALDMPELVGLMEGVTRLHAVPALMRQIVEEAASRAPERFARLRTLFTGGDAVPADLLARLRQVFPAADLAVLYGPTEGTVFCTVHEIPAGELPARSLLGGPLAGARVELRDGQGQRVPVGVPGEIWIAGPGVARGYAGLDELTAERFPAVAGRRYYRSGDLARRLADGSLEFLGRIDQQVKIRGFRIEPGEIEAVLGEHPEVRQAAVVAREDAWGDRRLVAYVVAADRDGLAGELRELVRERLPEYMIPAAFVTLKSLPLTSHGKLNRRLLPAPEWEAGSVYVAPRTPAEELLAGLWSDVLGVEQVGVHDDFFALGGHSLLATQLASRVRDAFGVDLPLRRLFESPTVEGVARLLRELGLGGPEAPPLRRSPRGGSPPPLSFAQERLWFLDRLEPDSPLYNLPAAVRLRGRLEIAALAAAIGEIVRRHETLRTGFAETADGPVQEVAAWSPWELPVADLSALAPAAREGESRRLGEEAAARPYDLSARPGCRMVRTALLRTAEREHVLLIGFHHIAADAWSVGVFVRELAALYAALVAGLPSPLPELAVQYADFAVWQREWLRGETLETQLAYWRRALAGAPEELPLPFDRPRPEVPSHRGARHRWGLPAGALEKLSALARWEGATAFMLLLAGFQALLARWSGGDDVVVGSPIANRNRLETEPLIGFFVNTLALRLDLSGGPSFRELARRTREATLGAYAHQDLPFEKLVEDLAPVRDARRAPVFQTLFALQNAAPPAWRLPGVEVELREIDEKVAKFDLALALFPEEGGGLAASLEYALDLFDGVTIERLGGDLETLLAGVLAEPDRPLAELALLGAAERRELLGGPERQRSGEREAAAPWAAPDTPTEKLLAGLWADLLGVRRVGLRDDFFELGGHSLLATRLASGVRATFSVDLPLRRFFERSTLEGLAVEIDAARLTSRELASLPLLRLGGPDGSLRPLSFAQERLWFLDRLEPGSPLYNLPASVRLRGELDTPALAVAIGEIVRRHEALRTGFAETAEGPAQEVAAWTPWELPVADLSALGLEARDQEALRLGEEAAARPFDLSARPGCRMLRTALLRVSGREHVLLIAFHHIAADGWSVGVFVRELAAIYEARVSGHPSPLPELAIQYADFAAWQRGWLRGEVLETDLAYWRRALAGAPVELPLPFDRPRPEVPSHRGVRHRRTFPAALVRQLSQLAQRQGATLFMLLLAAFQSLLARWSGVEDVVVGSPIANRNRAETEPLIGFFVNTLALRLELPGNPSFYEVMRRVRETALGAYAYQDLPFEKLVEALAPARDTRRSPIFQVLCGLQNASPPAWHLPGVEVEMLETDDKVAKFDLSLVFMPQLGGELAGILDYAVDLFDAATAERLGGDLMTLLATAVKDPDRPVLELPLLGALEREELIRRLERRAELFGEPAASPPVPWTAPRTPTEEMLAGIWAGVLEIDRVGARDDFFALGGHSLLATRVASQVRTVFGVALPLRRFFERQTVESLAAEIDAARSASRDAAPPPLEPLPRDGSPLPLSFAQQRLWFLEQLDPGNPTYNMPAAVRLAGPLSKAALEQALAGVVARHESLRTRFPAVAGEPAQVVEPALALGLEMVEVGGELAEREERMRRLVREESLRPFDLERGPLVRAALLRLEAEEHVLLFTLHHIVSDGWSTGVLVREVAALYESRVTGRPAALPELPIQYADFAVWQRRWLSGAALEREAGYWRQRLAGAPASLELPADRPRPQVKSSRGDSLTGVLAADLGAALRELSRRAGATLFMTLLAGLDTLLHRYTGQQDLLVGVPIANRNRAETEPLIGFFVNSLVMRADLTGDPGFSGLLARVRDTALEAYAHQDLPFEKVVEVTRPDRDLARSPLFQVAFALQNLPVPELRLVGLTLTPVAPGIDTVKFDWDMAMEESGDEIRVRWAYSVDLFDGATVQRALEHLRTLLAGAVAEPERSLSSLPLLTAPERQALLVESLEAAPWPADLPVHEGVARQAARTPEAVALALDGETLTYGRLDALANQMAHRLRRLGVGPEGVVGICLERSFELVAGLLGILKAGGAYLPLDPAYPRERLELMLRDSGAEVLVTREERIAGLDGGPPRSRILAVDADREAVARESERPPAVAVAPDHPAYVIYTSGSTGVPKGVMVSHRAMANRVGYSAAFDVDATAVFLQKTSISFDVSVVEIFAPLLAGGRSVLVRSEAQKDVDGLLRLIAGHGVTNASFPPSLLYVLLERDDFAAACRSLRTVVTGGEVVPADLPERFFARLDARLLNRYGPTEATVSVTSWDCRRGVEERVLPIGRPIADARVHVLDRGLQPVPAGVPGEIFLGGVCLARGYLRRPDLTALNFVPDPLAATPGERLYRTGDLARFRPDGALEFVGRVDGQVKIRGFRVELGEVEAALAVHPAVREVVVADREPAGGGATAARVLVAYVVAEPGRAATAAELRDHAHAKLPAHMVPSAFVTLERLPLGPTGKVDRRALPAPENAPREEAFAAPRTGAEARIAAIWSEVLEVERVGLHDNFFDLGGHSLLMARVHDRIRKELGREVSLVELFQYPTVATLADRLDRGAAAAGARPGLERAALRARSADRSPRLAIVGMAGRFPGAADIEAFWRNLQDGVESISFFSSGELRAEGIAAETLAHPRYVPAGGTLDGGDLFDAGFFGYTPREAELMDPQHRVFLECAWEALERAGYDPGAGGAVGVYAGASFSTYLGNLASRGELGGTGSPLLGNDKDFLATRVSYKLDLRGPSLTVQTACSTSLVAVHLACQALLAGECDMALAGGVSVSAPLKSGYVFQEGSIMSPDGHCRAFDAAAQGTVRGQGVGLVVLKRLRDALDDGDSIHAVLLGSALNNDGAGKVGYTAPSVEGQAAAIAEAQSVAGVEPASVGYVETHGTGTRLGDPIEIAALVRAFGPGPGRQSCAIGSLKTNIGHLDAAAGVAGLIKAALAVESGTIPPSLHFERPNPEIGLEESPFFVAAERREWPVAGPRRAGVSSFGIGGTNAHVVLEEPPAPAPSGPSRPRQLLLVSARSPQALEEATRRLAGFLEEGLDQRPDLELGDVAYTLRVGRRAFPHRRMVVCGDAAEAVAALRDPRRTLTWEAGEGDRGVVFLFPGQGAQHVGMGRDLYTGEAVFRDHVDLCARHLEPHLGLDLRAVLYPPAGGEEAARERLTGTALAQPALFVVESALAKLWMSWGVRPRAMLGHSIGEYVAAWLAGVFSLEDALALVAARGELMRSLPAGAMLAVPLPEREVEGLLGPGLALAAVNAPDFCVVSGPEPAVEELWGTLARAGIAGRRLATSHAFHSAMMDPILGAFEERVHRVARSAPSLPWVSNLTGEWIRPEEATDPSYWSRHLRATVRFAAGLETLLADPGAVLLEVGPGDGLTNLARRQPGAGVGRTAIASMRHPKSAQHDLETLLAALGRLWLAGARPDWAGFHAGERRRRVLLPTYPFERRRYWIAADAAGLERRPALERRPDLADWTYVPGWKRTPPPGADREAGGACLMFLDGCGLGAELAARLAAEGRPVSTVAAGGRFSRLDEGVYTLDPASADGYDALLADLEVRGRHPASIVHLWSVTAGHPSPAVARETGFDSLLLLAQALGRRGGGALDLTVVSSQAHEVTGGEEPCPDKALLLGPCRAIPRELPHVACRWIDVDGEAAAALAGRLFDEMSAGGTDPLVAYRGGHRWLRTWERARLEPRSRPAIRLREGGVYLVTGGMGGVGLTLAAWLAREAGARLILAGRSLPPPREEWPGRIAAGGEEGERLRRLQELEPDRVLLVQADVRSREEMAAAARLGRERFGAIHGAIHAAGLPGGGVLQLKTPEAAAATLAPKVEGTRNLAEALAGEPLDFLLLCSSLATVVGGFGNADYVSANAFLDAFAEARRPAGAPPVLSVAWDSWREVGMAARVPRGGPEMGMRPEEGCEVLRRTLAAGLPRVVVSTHELAGLMRLADSPDLLREAAASRRAGSAHPRPDLATPFVEPRSEAERRLADLWRELLGIEPVGVHDSFFELGGHSLLATQLISQVRDRFGAEVSFASFFDAPTVAALAASLEAPPALPGAEPGEDEEMARLLAEIKQLSGDDLQALLAAEREPLLEGEP
ncbi:MAG TPA: non-ribosomal peptide synthase/polyketide synthase [Thermoanaerobaculia bacterium]|nr:non-ribosomal peptide synthase/polyketide synthase [Thermoanaerobaculia bacterium]